MKKILTSIFTGLLFFVSVQAQITEGGAGFIKLGQAIAPNAENIYLQIAPDKIAGFTNYFTLIGAEVYYRERKNIITLEGSLGAQKANHSASIYTEPYCGAVHLSLGRIVAENKKFWIYPNVGGGISFITLMTYNKTDGVAKNIEYQTLTGPSINLGINGDILLSKFHLMEKYYLGSMLGVRVGYRTAFRNNHWKTPDNKEARNMPFYTNNACYLTVTFGGGSFDLK
jgi:hypothetical protein